MEHIVLLGNKGNGAIVICIRLRATGDNVWGKAGVAVSQMSELPATLYTGRDIR